MTQSAQGSTSPPSVSATADRLQKQAEIVYGRCTTRALALWDIWQSYNAQNGPAHDHKIGNFSEARPFSWLMQSALHETIIVITRAFDSSGKFGAARSNRVSFPVMLELLKQPGVRDEIIARAEQWLDSSNPPHHRKIVNEAIAEFEDILSRLATEMPNRLRRLRDYRDDFLAHNLVHDAEREKPIFQDVSGLLEEMVALTERSILAFSGHELAWEALRAAVRDGAEELWSAVRSAARNSSCR